ncbi:menaquinone-dependent protoporphyrinogen IX dehydrogenase [Chitinilyticum aquatile]|uniref:menaquinone-dependent protoporphyrinogen IX dehydrogenase n=1 Tax=Chitinilyticum aquatile TaxID=362520 RepID=UPI0003F65630|nr:menaquinone-dependent protoporphyrinogen IX dehydrogenase [Chitinilyticum aquatile]
MSRVLVLLATRHGHTRRIADFILAQSPVPPECEWHDLLAGVPQPSLPLVAYERILIVASVRYGHFPPALTAFVRQYRAQLATLDVALVGVNLVARKPGKDTPSGNPYLRKLLVTLDWQPARCIAVAGALAMPAYPRWQQLILQLIMRLTGSPVTRATVRDYTDWEALAQWSAGYWQAAMPAR